MPNATVNTEATRYELNTCEGGFVSLKALTFGQLLERREKASRMSMDQQTGSRKAASQRINFDLMQRWARTYDFEHCIIDHNLEDARGEKLNFSNKMTLDLLDPKVGAEIEALIDDLNQEEDEEDLDDFLKQHTPDSKDET